MALPMVVCLWWSEEMPWYGLYDAGFEESATATVIPPHTTCYQYTQLEETSRCI